MEVRGRGGREEPAFGSWVGARSGAGRSSVGAGSLAAGVRCSVSGLVSEAKQGGDGRRGEGGGTEVLKRCKRKENAAGHVRCGVKAM